MKCFLESLKRAGLTIALGLLVSCGGGGGGGGGSSSGKNPGPDISGPVVTGDNVMTVSINAGPNPAVYQVNRLHASVTVCQPGTGNCATINDVMVDSGSTGLRLLASSLPSSLNLRNSNPSPLMSCQRFLDGSFSWGPVVNADIYLGDRRVLKAANVPMQLVGDSEFNHLSQTCSTSGQPMLSVDTLGANGILGIGINVEDCGPTCAGLINNTYYYRCTGNSCSGSTASLAEQVQNPVPHLSSDNTGYAVVLPAVPAGGANSLSNGQVFFGIGTRSNNSSTTVKVLTTRANTGYISSTGAFGVRPNSFLDTGSNSLFFDDSNLTRCTPANGFYCPLSSRSYTATLTGLNGVSQDVSFTVGNASPIFENGSYVVPALAGPINSTTVFDWGLPFFFGRTVFIGIEGKTSTIGGSSSTGPFYAF